MIAFLKKYRGAVIYILTVLLSILYIVFGSKIASRNFYFGNVSTLEYSATVLRVIDVQEDSYTLSGSDNTLTSEQVTFEARVTSGSLKGITVTATQQRDSIVAVMPKRVEAGDDVILSYASDSELDENGNVVENGNYIWIFAEYNRIPGLFMARGIFLFLSSAVWAEKRASIPLYRLCSLVLLFSPYLFRPFFQDTIFICPRQ